jgi:DNA-binding transcriptional ArsR family regulator
MPFESTEITDPAVMRALAHPVRLRILARLAESPATATECADAVGESPSSCSYHLRTLAKAGFVEEAPAQDARERRWKVRTHSWRFSSQGKSPEVVAAGEALRMAYLQADAQILDQYLLAESNLPEDWQEAALFRTANVFVTADELRELGARLSEAIDPYSRHDPAERPAGGRRVHLHIWGVPFVEPGRTGDAEEESDVE